MRITNEALAERIDAVHETVKAIKDDVKLNTEFRSKAKGAIAVLVFAAGMLGAGIVTLGSKFVGMFKNG